ncbi:hypothetical protein Y11_11891 [Yersinia enterocolitica subsp. palearctica Y11]|uniref:Uncharacterized protein n=2 Tax=Yersinia enterocolitica TaxID=630 RepID=A0A0H3NPH3_YERE1|nr:unknown protein [Yersinia enterocolitica W22703]CBY26992.1 hypothetical protein Y11_11891 [Yersinia enterocolitica subsp. palearctica Y11]CCO68434.1 hypothetical protein D322_1560 [Yersinia enterocolitica IP 10393]
MVLCLGIIGEILDDKLNLLTSLCQHMLSGRPCEEIILLNDVLKQY